MAIAGFKGTNPPITPKQSTIYPEAYQGIVVDTDQQQLGGFAPYIDGSPWAVSYYQQVLGASNDLKDADPSQVGLYQQYNKIINYELRIIEGLTTSQDEANATMSGRGSANLYPFMIPNVHNLFIARTLAGDLTLFSVTNVTRTSLYRNSAYRIDFETVNILNPDSERYLSLESKVIKTYYFDKSRLVAGVQPLLVAADYYQANNLMEQYHRLLLYYLQAYLKSGYDTLILPGQSNSLYDPFLVDFFLKTIDFTDYPEVSQIRRISLDSDPYFNQLQIWKILYDRDKSLLPLVDPAMGWISSATGDIYPVARGIRYNRIDYLLYPKNAQDSPLSGQYRVPKLTTNKTLTTTTSPLINLSQLSNYTGIPLIHPITDVNPYLFSQSFYLGDNGMSLLELLVQDYLNQRPINIPALLELINHYYTWAYMDQFYYGPVLLLLMRVANWEIYR